LNPAAWRNFVIQTPHKNLSFLPAGKTPPNPGAILASSQMGELAAEFKREFDYVLFDVPPILVVSDAVSLAKYIDGVILVARYGFTVREDLIATRNALDLVNAKLLGAILNGVPRKDGVYFTKRYRSKYYSKYYTKRSGADSELQSDEEKVELDSDWRWS
jgi:Mrp family chromosome partitioning ATPase